MNIWKVVKKPLITEKTNKVNALTGQYAFEVAVEANKLDIKKAIEALFDVKVHSIRTLTQKGKDKTRYTRKGIISGRTKTKKKAYVRLENGFKIDLASGEGSQD